MTSKKEVAFWEAMAAKWQEEAREQQREKIDAVLELEIERDFYKDWAKKCELWWKEAESQVGGGGGPRLLQKRPGSNTDRLSVSTSTLIAKADGTNPCPAASDCLSRELD